MSHATIEQLWSIDAEAEQDVSGPVASGTAASEPVMHVVPSTPVPGMNLTAEQVEEIGRRLDAIRSRVESERGAADSEYIHSIIALHRKLEIAGRGLLFAGILPPAWVAGTAMLSVAKILENMELGHNIIHGQWDWMNDPEIHSSTWEWDTMSTSEAWKHSHNYRHHTFTNVIGEDRDVGYGILRMSEEQKWNPYYLGNPLYNLLLSTFFQYGVALHDLEVEKVASGEKSVGKLFRQLKGMGGKVGKQLLKDYVVFPALSGPSALPVIAGNLTANLARNVWSHAVIFCGHFPEGVAVFEQDQLEDETRGGWYVRQMMGSANFTGGKLMHLLSGNLCFQIEHHCFPDLPSNRYAEIATEVEAICNDFGIDYTSGTLWGQYIKVLKKINRLALP